ncbi:cupin domain-containing protein [Ktedonospora formicarum]|uniref:Carbohydrate-binding protein n=1 Tax=Ktedonospora formicarum TaxID=2778364 RepID=A0A8J3MVF5_9CHLR|nr:cupin domain-containing protein [Ktedonospora formicarum]GHO50247.1 carbohydrate-binding protein [Ktedonospora formicarum]
MKHVRSQDVPSDVVREPGAKQATIKRLIDTTDGADRFVLSLFEVTPNGSTPPHYHDWEHEIFIVDGSMTLQLPDEKRDVKVSAGDVVFIPRNEPHGFITGADETCRFLVVAPTERPPIRNYFMSEDPYQYEETAGHR